MKKIADFPGRRRDSDAVIPPANQSPRQPFKSQKGGKISPAAKRFPLSPHREAVKPPLLVPVFRDRLLGELVDGKPVRFDPGEDRLDDVRGKAVQGKNAGHVAGLQAELLRQVGHVLGLAIDQLIHPILQYPRFPFDREARSARFLIFPFGFSIILVYRYCVWLA